MKKNKGISLIVLIVIIAVILILGAVILLIVKDNKNTNAEGTNDSQIKNENIIKEKETKKTTVPENYIGIYSIDDYNKFFTGEYSLKGNYILMDDLDFSSVSNCNAIGWKVNPDYIPSFEGVFDGNYCTISNFTINVPDGETNRTVGFFANVKNGTIKNLNFLNAKIISTVKTYDIGVLAGTIEKSIVENCNIQGEIVLNGEQGAGSVGFIAGSATGGVSLYDELSDFSTIITNCIIDGKISGNNSDKYSNAIGGAFGQLSDGSNRKAKAENIIVNLEIASDTISGSGFASVCSAHVNRCGTNVEINSKSEDNIAGFISSINGAHITECYSKGNITAGKFVSGFINTTTTLGYTSDCGIKDCYTDVNITVLADVDYDNTSALFVRKIKDNMENVYGTGSITFKNGKKEKYFIEKLLAEPKNVYYNKEIFKGNEQYLTGLTTQQMKMKTSYSGFDFKNVWDIDEGKTTPYLRWEKK